MSGILHIVRRWSLIHISSCLKVIYIERASLCLTVLVVLISLSDCTCEGVNESQGLWLIIVIGAVSLYFCCVDLIMMSLNVFLWPSRIFFCFFSFMLTSVIVILKMWQRKPKVHQIKRVLMIVSGLLFSKCEMAMGSGSLPRWKIKHD